MFGIAFVVDSFAAAFLGAIIISIVSIILSLLLPNPKRREE
jgi:uncharacterized membrane protein YvlD (DUF360 family)